MNSCKIDDKTLELDIFQTVIFITYRNQVCHGSAQLE